MTISFTAGQLLTAAEMTMLCPTYVVKASNQGVTNSATLVNDTDLVFTLLPNQTYEVDLWGDYAGNGTTNTGLRAAWAVTGTVAMTSRFCQGPGDAAGAALPDSVLMQSRPMAAINTNNLYTSGIVAGAGFVFHEKLIVTGGVSGGTLQFQFAQFTATAAQTMTMLATSYAVARMVA